MEDSYHYDRSIDDVYDVLSHRTRRALVYILGRTESTSLDTVTRDLLDLEGDWADGAEADGGTDRIKVELHHVHLPRMAASGMLEYDTDTGAIRTNGTLDVAYQMVDSVARDAAE
jgi:hypothetical protein